ncbi:MAG: hypothetical protein ACRDQ1_11810 [Sciscionella sp.]
MTDHAKQARLWIGYATEDPAETGQEIRHPHAHYAAVAQAHAILAVAAAIEAISATRGRP